MRYYILYYPSGYRGLYFHAPCDSEAEAISAINALIKDGILFENITLIGGNIIPLAPKEVTTIVQIQK